MSCSGLVSVVNDDDEYKKCFIFSYSTSHYHMYHTTIAMIFVSGNITALISYKGGCKSCWCHLISVF